MFTLSVSKLQKGKEINNLVLRDNINSSHQNIDYLYNIDNTAISAKSGEELIQSERAPNTYYYSVISPFLINSNGKQIIAFSFIIDKEYQLEVILYQEDEFGRLFRLTSIPERIKRNNVVATTCHILNSDSSSLKEYDQKDMLHYSSLLDRYYSKYVEFQLKDFEDFLLSKEDKFILEVKDFMNIKTEKNKKEGEEFSISNISKSTFSFVEVFGLNIKRLTSSL